jgi:hypothetical protein
VATHSRLPAGARYHYQTDEAHPPRKHIEWLKTEGYDAAYFRAWAREIGPVTEWAIGQILLTKIHEPQSYRSCLGTLALACALGNHACTMGLRTLYFNMNRFCEQIAVAKAEGTVIKWLDRLTAFGSRVAKKARLLILDDFGLQPIMHPVKLLLLQLLEDRY